MPVDSRLSGEKRGGATFSLTNIKRIEGIWYHIKMRSILTIGIKNGCRQFTQFKNCPKKLARKYRKSSQNKFIGRFYALIPCLTLCIAIIDHRNDAERELG